MNNYMSKKKANSKETKQTTSKTAKQPAKKTVKKEGTKITRLRGIKDVAFNDYRYWELILKKVKDLSNVYGFKNVEIPVLEREDLYEKVFGKDDEFFAKKLYSFTDKNKERVSIRPVATPSLARLYLEQSLNELEKAVKFSWTGPVFRFEKPQSGQYRQFHQFNLEVFGEENPVADFMLIMIAYKFFSELQIGTQVQINHMGCSECRAEYLDKLKKYLRSKKSKACVDCKKQINTSPLQIFNCDKDCCAELKQDAPPIVDFLCEKCQANFTLILEYLDEVDVPYNLNPCLVRELNYYNYGPVYEFWDLDENGEAYPGFNLGGGGRFDNLVASIGGKETPACGFSLGLERTLLKMKKNNIPIDGKEENVIFLAQLGEQARRRMLILFEEFRKAGYTVKQAFIKNSLKEQLEEAEEYGAKLSLILGQKEVNDKTVLIRDMESGNQEVVDYKKVHNEVEKRLQNGESKK